jgi:methyl-accepting chemotaxis protein
MESKVSIRVPVRNIIIFVGFFVVIIFEAFYATVINNFVLAPKLRFNFFWGIQVALIILILVLRFVLIYVEKSMLKPLAHIADATEAISKGDLTLRSTMDSRNDEMGVISRNFNKALDFLSLIVHELQGTIHILEKVGSEIINSSIETASSTSETASAISETSTTVEELHQTADLSNKKAQYVMEISQKAVDVSKTGLTSVDNAILAMNDIQEQMKLISDSILSLSDKSQLIGEIVSTTENIAEQSNILAINASIEAAKAGEYGKGFSVVAMEVKSLAEQSKSSIGRIRTILGDIQKATNRAVLVTENGSKAVDRGTEQSNESRESIHSLSSIISEASQASVQIAASSHQQLVGTDHVSTAMENIREASHQNVVSMKLVESSAKNLKDLSNKLSDLANKFKL